MSEGDGAGAPIAPSGADAIELRDITKRFPGVVANDHVTLHVAPGTIHAIVGENGAGKSTLMKVLYGSLKPDEGTITVNGIEQHFKSPKDAIDAGIGMVFQHFMLADNFTVWENVVLGDEPGTAVKLNIREAKAKIRELALRYGLHIDPDEMTEELGVGARQRVEILKVLYRGARIIILDEPTAVLVPQEVDELFNSLRELVAGGVTVIFISHKLNEVLSVADAITVIRAGRTVTEVLPQDVTAKQLAELMVGSELPSPETKAMPPGEHVALAVAGVNLTEGGRPVLSDIDLEVHRGEIVGIAGVEGNGQDELINVIMGIDPPDSGSVELDGRDITKLNTRDRREQGIGYIPQDRHRDGLVLDSPLWENVMLGHQTSPTFVRRMIIDRGSARRRTEEIIAEFDVRTPGPDVDALALSGGNQQKLIVGKEMMADPTVLIAAQPTRGVDVGAQADIWDHLREARAADLAVLMVSADLEELIGLSDTLYVIYRGRLVAKLDPSTVTPSELGEYMTGAHTQQGAA
jgi:simple sugar transport system ATP-binding protein